MVIRNLASLYISTVVTNTQILSSVSLHTHQNTCYDSAKQYLSLIIGCTKCKRIRLLQVSQLPYIQISKNVSQGS